MIAHGTASKYSNDGCRCQPCTAAWAEYNRDRKRARRAFVQNNGLPLTVEHGESAYFNWGCRCDRCAKAAYAGQRRRYHARRSTTAT